LKWTQSFLTGRTLQVKLPGALSEVGQVIAGVPQGGVIFPLLFDVHIDDVDKDIPSSLGIKSCKFADDLTLYQKVPLHSERYMQQAVLDISTRPLAQASVKSVGRVQILDHSPVWRVQFS